MRVYVWPNCSPAEFVYSPYISNRSRYWLLLTSLNYVSEKGAIYIYPNTNALLL